MKIIAIDPGKVTGIVRAYPDNDNPGEWYMRSSEIQSTDIWGELSRIFHPTPPDVVICERYTISQRTAKLSAQYDALYIIGALHYLVECEGNFNTVLHLQSPSEAKGFMSNQKLKHLGLYWSSSGGHQADAMRHLLYYMVFKKKDPYFITKLQEMLT